MLGRTVLRDDHIFVEYPHVTDGSDLLDRARDVADLLAGGAPRRVLLDARHVIWAWTKESAGPTAQEVMTLLPQDLRIAVLNQAGATMEQNRPFHAFFHATGYTIAHFRSATQALTWLLGDEPPPAEGLD